VFSHNNYAKT